jgi:hypothetical protein
MEGFYSWPACLCQGDGMDHGLMARMGMYDFSDDDLQYTFSIILYHSSQLISSLPGKTVRSIRAGGTEHPSQYKSRPPIPLL